MQHTISANFYEANKEIDRLKAKVSILTEAKTALFEIINRRKEEYAKEIDNLKQDLHAAREEKRRLQNKLEERSEELHQVCEDLTVRT